MSTATEGPFKHFQPFFYWACVQSSNADTPNDCDYSANTGVQGTTPMEWSFNFDSGFQGTDMETKQFYVAVYHR